MMEPRFELRWFWLQILLIFSGLVLFKSCFPTPIITAARKLNMAMFSPGGLFRSQYGKRQEPWNPCQLYHGMCRNACRKNETQYLTCPNRKKCCLKFSVKIARSNNVKDYDPDSNLSVTNTSSYSKIWISPTYPPPGVILPSFWNTLSIKMHSFSCVCLSSLSSDHWTGEG